MPGLGENILSLSRLRQARAEAMANMAEPLRLKLVAPARNNPGELRMLTYIPPGLPPGAPLVVVLHGCTQNAAAYDHGAGWSALAERHGFALLFPEQQRANNPQLCFNWFRTDDTTAGQGEAESIRQMTLQVIAAQQIDPRRVFITGLSAGGAMTAVLLATSPDLFAAGAVIAGLPYRAAASVNEALGAMRQPPRRTAAEWGRLVRAASTHTRPWPALQVWHGTADSTVTPANADALVCQWADLLGTPAQPDTDEVVDGAAHQAWSRDGRPVLELWKVPGLGHGTPIASGQPDQDHNVGNAGPYMLDAGVSSTWHLARSWGLLTQAARAAPLSQAPGQPRAPAARPLTGPASLVEKTLRAVGVLKG